MRSTLVGTGRIKGLERFDSNSLQPLAAEIGTSAQQEACRVGGRHQAATVGGFGTVVAKAAALTQDMALSYDAPELLARRGESLCGIAKTYCVKMPAHRLRL